MVPRSSMMAQGGNDQAPGMLISDKSGPCHSRILPSFKRNVMPPLVATLKLLFVTLPWALVRFLGRTITRFFIVLGALVVLGVLSYVGFEYLVEAIDSRYSDHVDVYLDIDKNQISRLHDPAYFAEQSVIVSEDQKTVACISSPEQRILIHDPDDIPPFFSTAILASEDKNFFTHEGIDKGAIVRALAKQILQESRSGASTLTMQIAKHLRHGTGRPSTETERIGDIVMALRIEREFSRQQLLLKYVNMPYYWPRPIRYRSGQLRVF